MTMNHSNWSFWTITGQKYMSFPRAGLRIKTRSLFDSGINDKCPDCSSKVSQVDVIEEIIDFAQRTDTKIEFANDNQILHELVGVGYFA